MASLARSLLALAVLALLQAACAQRRGEFPGPFRYDNYDRYASDACKTYKFGRFDGAWKQDELPPIHVSDVNSEVEIHDPKENSIETILIGQVVVACDRARGVAPDVRLSSPDNFKFLEVTEGDCVPKPAHIELRVTRYRAINLP